MIPKIDLPQKFAPLFASDARYFVIRGGRSSGKSHAVNAWAVMLTFEEGHTILHTRYTAATAKDSIIADVKARIDEMELSQYFTVTRDTILNKETGSKIIFKGLKASRGDEKARLKSISGVTTWIVEEAEDLREEDEFDIVDLSIRGSKKNKRLRTVLVMNPTDTEHFVYRRWFASKEYDVTDDYCGIKKDTCYILTSWKDVRKHLSASEINSLMRIKRERPEYYKYAIEGAWMHQREGVIYPNWSVRDYEEQSHTIIGLDFGFNHPTAMVEVSIDHVTKCMFARELLYKPEMTPDDIFNFIVQNKLMDKKFVADSARPEIISYLKKKSSGMLRVRASKKGAGSVLDGIHLVQDYTMFIDPQSHNLQKELNLYVWDEKKTEVPKKEWDDACDAMRYAVMALKRKKSLNVY